MAKIVLNFGKVRNLEVGRVYRSKYELLDELFDGVIKSYYTITVTRDNGTYRKTSVPLDLCGYMMGLVHEYCLIELIGSRKLRIADVYQERLAG
jgi:hypothetical protein